MNLNTTSLPDLTSLTQEEVIQECEKLFNCNQQLKQLQEQDKQKIYELTRNLNTANATEAYLSAELESLSLNQANTIEEIQRKHNLEIETYKKKCSELEIHYSALEKKSEELQKTNEKLLYNITELESRPSSRNSSDESNDCLEKRYKLEAENLDLLAELNDCHQKINQMTLEAAQKETTIEMLKEDIRCFEETLNHYKIQFEEKSNLIEKAQEEIIQLKIELKTKETIPENENKKGNSLFAEVDDQRQAMKKLLADQKQGYLEMKKKYLESQHEMRRLKRENSEICKNIQVCSELFLSAEKKYKEKLNEKINQLIKEKERLESKLTWTEDKLILVSSKCGVNLIDSMLNFAKEETQNLQDQLRSLHVEKGLLEENLYNSQKELAKWRFEALKLRFVLKHRESILEEHNIKFDTSDYSNFEVTENECQTAKPNISFSKKIFNIQRVENSESHLNTEDTMNKNLNNSNRDELQKTNCKKSTIHDNPIQTEFKKPLDNENVFEVYEDTTMLIPIIKQNKPTTDSIKADEKENLSTLQLSSIIKEYQNNVMMQEDKIDSKNNFSVFEDTTTNINFLNKKEDITLDEKENFEPSKSYDFINTKNTKPQNHFQIYESFTDKDEVNQMKNVKSIESSSSSSMFKSLENSSILDENYESNKLKEKEDNEKKVKSSILVQNRDILNFADYKKSVKFEKEVTNDSKDDKPQESNKSNVRAVVRKIRTKSDMIIRRIEIQPRREQK